MKNISVFFFVYFWSHPSKKVGHKMRPDRRKRAQSKSQRLAENTQAAETFLNQ